MASTTADFMIRLINRVSGPARAIKTVLDQVAAAEDSVTKSSGAAQAAVSAVGVATASAATKAAASVRSFDRVADAIKRVDSAAKSAAASAAVPTTPLRFGANGAFAGGYLGNARAVGRGDPFRAQSYAARMHAQRNAVHGPVLDTSRDFMGPVLNRRAQNLGVFDRINVATKGVREATSSLLAMNSAAGEGIARFQGLTSAFMGTPLGMVAGGLGSIAGVLLDIGKAAVSAAFSVGKVVVGLGAVAGVIITKKTVEMAGLAESSQLAFKNLTGSASAGKTWLDASVAAATRFGADISQTIDQFKSLRAAQFELGQAKALVGMSADLVAVTGHADAAERAIRAITQIKSAGRLQGDELNQLAEAGVSRDLVYQQLEKRFGTNRAGVIKRQEAGRIDAASAITAIQDAVAVKLHTRAPGDAARAMSATTLDGMVARLKNLPDLVLFRIARGMDTGPVKQAIGTISKAIEGIDGEGLRRFVKVGMDMMPKAADFVVGFFRGFGSGLDSLISKLTMGEGNFKSWGESAGVNVSKFFGGVLDGAKWLATEGPKAWESFKKGLGIEAISESLKEMNFEALGENLNKAATAIGKIVNLTLTLATNVDRIMGGIGLVKDLGRMMTDPLGAAANGTDIVKSMRANFAELTRESANENEATATVVRPLRQPEAGGRRVTNQRVNVSVVVNGNASKEDADAIGGRVAEKAQDALSSMSMRAANYTAER